VAEKVVIIGSGPAGWSAAIYAARANLEPIIFEGALSNENQVQLTLPLGQLALRFDVENYPGFPSGFLSAFLDSAIDEERRKYMFRQDEKHSISGPELMELMRQQAKNFGVRVVTDDVVKVNFKLRQLKVKPRDENWLETETVILAPGSKVNSLGLASEETFKNRGVTYCVVSDATLPRFRNQPFVVVGGGDSAMEDALFLTQFASKVFLVHRRDSFRASKTLVERTLASDKVQVMYNQNLHEILGDEDGVSKVKLRNTLDDSITELPTAGVDISIGYVPNTAFLKGQVKMNEEGFIKWKTPFRTHTSVPGVFAAGDAADNYYRQAVTAAGTGCMAALDAERYLAQQN